MLTKVILWVLSFIPHITIERPKGVPYLTRYYLLGGPRYGLRKPFPWNVYLHCFHVSDAPVPHNHPWAWAKSLILRGAYLEHRMVYRHDATWVEKCVYTPGKWNTLYANTFHWVDLITPTVWTLFITGPRISKAHQDAWGFQTPQGFVPESIYKRAHNL